MTWPRANHDWGVQVRNGGKLAIRGFCRSAAAKHTFQPACHLRQRSCRPQTAPSATVLHVAVAIAPLTASQPACECLDVNMRDSVSSRAAASRLAVSCHVLRPVASHSQMQFTFSDLRQVEQDAAAVRVPPQQRRQEGARGAADVDEAAEALPREVRQHRLHTCNRMTLRCTESII